MFSLFHGKKPVLDAPHRVRQPFNPVPDEFHLVPDDLFLALDDLVLVLDDLFYLMLDIKGRRERAFSSYII